MTRLEVTVPEHWWSLPVDPATSQQHITDLVDRRFTQKPELSPQRSAIIKALEGLSEDAVQAGAVFAAEMGLVEGADALAANVLVVVRRLEREGSLLDQVLSLSGTDPEGSATVETVSLRGTGPAVSRCADRRLTRAGLEDGIDILQLQYFIPVPNSDATAVVTFSSPNTEEKDILLELFEAIAQTIEFVDSDDKAVSERH